jgi:hypothetical protein
VVANVAKMSQLLLIYYPLKKQANGGAETMDCFESDTRHEIWYHLVQSPNHAARRIDTTVKP